MTETMDGMTVGTQLGFGWQNVFFTALGVFLIWSSWGAGKLSVKYLNTQLTAFGLPPNALLAIEFGVTMVCGVILAITFVEPQTPSQAIAGGMGWTSLVAKPTDRAEGGGGD